MKPLAILTQVLEVIAALAVAPLFLGWVNQCRAWLQNRSAPSLRLPYRNIRKLFHKEAVIAENASRFFRLAPYVVFAQWSSRRPSFHRWARPAVRDGC
jgi:formate hydrogenlyase subunit 4